MANADAHFLLMHGAGLGSWIWDGFIPELNAPAEAIDLPGRGDGRNPGDVTLSQCIDYAAACAAL